MGYLYVIYLQVPLPNFTLPSFAKHASDADFKVACRQGELCRAFRTSKLHRERYTCVNFLALLTSAEHTSCSRQTETRTA